MNIATAPDATYSAQTASRSLRRMNFFTQTGMLTWRALIVNLRAPVALLPSLLISLFTLFIYDAQFSGAAKSFLSGGSYLGFILPLSILSAALSGAGLAANTVVRDIETGYFDKLSLTPLNRWALLLGAILAGGIALLGQTTLILLVGVLMGLSSATGIGGMALVIGFALLFGMAFSAFLVGIALITGNAAATNGSSFLFFPFTFLTATFVPVEQLTGWIKVVAQFNPITYALEATRAALNTGWDAMLIGKGLVAGGLMFVLFFAFALFGQRARSRAR